VLHYHLGGQENRQRAKAMYERAITLATAQQNDAAATQLVRDRATRAMADAKANLTELSK